MKKQPFRFTLFLLICLSLPMIATAQTVAIPDPNLRAAIETTLGKASGTPITAAEMETLTFFRAIDANISVLTGLESATNLTYLFLWNNSISDLTPLSGLTNLQFLDLQGNSVSNLAPVMGLTNLIFLGIRNNAVSELSPLVANTELGEKNAVNVKGNLLNYPSIYRHIPTLQSRGVEVSFDNRTPTAPEIISGDAQSDTVGVALAQPFVVEVRDENGEVFEGVPVTFTVTAGGGTIQPAIAMTDADGLAQSTLTLGNDPGTNTVEVSVEGISQMAVFNAEATLPPPMPTTLSIVSGDNQNGLIGEALANPFVVEVRDQYDDPMAGVPVTFTVLTGDGSLSLEMGLTDANGQAESRLTLGNEPGGYTVTVSVEGIIETATFNAEASLPPPMPTALEGISGNNQTDLTSERLMNPFVVEVRDQYNDSMEGVTVAFIVRAGGGSLSDTSVITDANGLAESTLTLGSDPGTNTVEASVKGISQMAVFSAEANLPPPEPTVLSIVSGDNQNGLTGATLMNPFIVEVRDQYNDSMEGVTVAFIVRAGGGSLSDTSVITDANGLAESTLTLGSDPGTNTVEASVKGISQMAVFSAEANLPPPEPTVLSIVSGDNQNGLTGATLMNPFIVEVRDQYNDPMEGVTVAFIVKAGRGSLSDTSVITDANGLAESWLTLGSDPGTNTVEASVKGISQMAVFSAEANLPPPEPTVLSIISGDNQNGLTDATLMNPFIVEVRDQYNDPMEGVTVAFIVKAGRGSLSDTSVITDANGLAESWLTLGSDPGTNTVEASVKGISQMAVFSAEANLPPPEPTVLSIISGDNQNGLTDATLMNPFIVEVRDQYNDPMEGVTVAFIVKAGRGSLSDTSVITDANGLAESWLTLGSDPGTNTVTVSVEGIIEIVTFNAVAELREFDLSVPSGISLIHVPLKVRAVDGVAGALESVADLYDALGGADAVNFLITYTPATQAWFAYFGASDTGTSADRELTEEMGILIGMRAPASIRFGGDALGTDGSSTITLNQGISFVGLPLRDSRITRVSDLFGLEGIMDNVPAIVVSDNGEFKAVVRAGDNGDIPITGGQSFILFAQQAATVAISGEAWTNVSGTAAAPLVAMRGIEVGNTTPVLALTGSIVDVVNGINSAGLRVIVKNLSTGSAVTTVIEEAGSTSSQVGYRLTVVDIEGGRAAAIGDILEISVQSPDASIGVQPLRYIVTAEDVKRYRIELPELIVQEIPAETELLRNYPNPFNPETWIPYRLAEDAFVILTIYDGSGRAVRTLDVGHQVAAAYESRSKAIYWDGRNEVGERVASGVYFYHLSADNYSATRKMLILK